MSNQNKRIKKFTNQLSFLSSNPNYEIIKNLYASNEVKSIPSAEKLLKSIKYTKSGKLFKTSEAKQQKLENLYDGFKMFQSVKAVEKFKVGKHLDYTHDIPVSRQLYINPESLDKLSAQIKAIAGKHPDRPNMRVRLVIEDVQKDVKISTAFHKTMNMAVKRMLEDHVGPKSREYEGAEFSVQRIVISYLKVNHKVMGASNPRSIEQANNKWVTINPISRSQCVFHAVACCRNYKKNKALLDPSLGRLKLSAKELKDCVKPTRNNYADDLTIQEICEYVKQPINLYNNLFQKIKTFTPAVIKKLKEEYNIQRNNNHCLALINKKELLSVYPDFVTETINQFEAEPNTEDLPIKKKRYVHEYNKNIGSWDIEASLNEKNEFVPYACSVAWPVNDDLKEQQFWGLDCMKQMLKFIYDNESIFKKITLYAHNGGKFDLPLLIKNGLLDSPEFQIEGDKCLELNNAWIGFTMRSKISADFVVVFRDSFRLLPMSLEKIAKELKVKHQKLTETVSHKDITLQNYMTFPQLPLYLTHDVFGLLEVMLNFGKNVFDELGIDITKCFTGASMSKINFFKNYYETKYAVFSLSDKHDCFIRDGYFGGRVEVFNMMKQLYKKIYYYDFTSLYPDVGRKNLPYGKPIERTFNNATSLDINFFGFVKCLCKTKDLNAIPKHAILKDSRLIFPIFIDYTEIKIFSEEIDYDIYEYKFIEGLEFKKAKFKAKFFNDGFQRKAQAKADNNPAMSQAHKIIINSGYGFWGLRTMERDGVIISSSENPTYLPYLHSDRLINIMEHGDYTFSRVKKDLDVKDFNVGVAAAISSYARLKLHKLLTAIKKAGGEIFYSDTDSVICNINLNDHPALKKEFQWDGNGVELGSLKNECDEYVEKVVNKETKSKEEAHKLYNELLEKENGNFHFDNLVVTGCKQYALQKTITINNKPHTIEIVKLKGFSQSKQKLLFSDMVNVSDGNEINQLQTQFRCPKSNYVSDTDTFKITSKDVLKKFNKVYTKGTINEDLTVSPIKIN